MIQQPGCLLLPNDRCCVNSMQAASHRSVLTRPCVRTIYTWKPLWHIRWFQGPFEPPSPAPSLTHTRWGRLPQTNCGAVASPSSNTWLGKPPKPISLFTSRSRIGNLETPLAELLHPLRLPSDRLEAILASFEHHSDRCIRLHAARSNWLTPAAIQLGTVVRVWAMAGRPIDSSIATSWLRGCRLLHPRCWLSAGPRLARHSTTSEHLRPLCCSGREGQRYPRTTR